MFPDLDIYRSANVLVKQYGQDAPIHAAMRADAMLEAGDLGGLAVWKRIVKAVGGASVEGTARRGYSSIARKPASPFHDDQSAVNTQEKKSGAARAAPYRFRDFPAKIRPWTLVVYTNGLRRWNVCSWG